MADIKEREAHPVTEDCMAPGSMVGEYRIVEQIGAGGMGVVYLGVHPVIDKRVAIKVLRPEVAADQDLVDRFVTEARAVNAIEHQNIIDVFSFGRLPDGRHYYVMEYLNGISLEELLVEQGRLPLEEALPLLRQVADAVDAAHERHIIHRDLKPENIYLVKRRSGKFRVIVLDFGVAKLSFGPQKTASGMVMGTPLYMSPEQCLGRVLDHRTDIYALATIAYRMLSGCLPFSGESVQVVMYQQISTVAPPPSELGAPACVDSVLLRSLDKDPERRHTSMTQLVDDLAIAHGVPAATPWPQEDTQPCVALPVGTRGKSSQTRKSSLGSTTACMPAVSPIRFEGHRHCIQRVAYCPAGGIFASAGDDHTVRLWSDDGSELAVFRGHSNKVEQLAFSPHGHVLVSTGSDGRVLVWSVYGGTLLRTLTGHRGRVNGLDFSPDGEQFVTGGGDGTVRLWTVSNGKSQVLCGHTSVVRAVAFSPTGRAIASAGDDRTVRLWKDGQGERIVLTGHRRAVYSVAFSPDGQNLASGGHDGLVCVWRVSDGKSTVFSGHSGIVWHVQYSPDGEQIASASSDGSVRLWSECSEPQVLSGHERRVRECVFSPDGRTLATVSIDGTVRLWNATTGKCTSILSHSGPARSAAFAPSGDWIVSSSGRASLVMTPVSELEVAEARGKTAR